VTNLRVGGALGEDVTTGTPKLRVGGAIGEDITTGSPKLRVGGALGEDVTTGSPKLRVGGALGEDVTTGSPQLRLGSAMIEYVFSYPVNPLIPTVAFPTLATLNGAGQGWSVHRRPTYSTRIAAAVSGREVRSPYYTIPLYEFELTFDGLYSGNNNLGAIPAQSQQLLMGFFLSLQGQYGAWLFTDPDFNQVSGGTLGIGDGTTAVFPLLRTVGNYSEQVQAANIVTTVYLNGVAQAGGSWAVANGNTISFATPPGANVTVTADFTYYFVCRFLDDVHDYEEFMYQMHTLQSCKFRSVRTS
jgi:hypothetical protein